MTNSEEKFQPEKELCGQINILPTANGESFDQVSDIVKQILGREKDNEEAVRKLKELIGKAARKQVQTALVVEETDKQALTLAQENEAIDEAVKGIRNELGNLQRFLKNLPEGEEQTALDPTLQCLKDYLKAMADNSRQKEKELEDMDRKMAEESGKLPKRGDDHPLIETENEKRKLLDDLQEKIKDWLSQLACCLRIPDNAETGKKFDTFAKGIWQIIDLLNECLSQESSRSKLKEKRAQLETKKNQLHVAMNEKRGKRMPIDQIPPKIRAEFVQIRQSRDKSCQQMPQASNEDAVYLDLEAMYNYGERELQEFELQLQEICRRTERSKKEKVDDEKFRKLHLKAKEERIGLFEERVEKLKWENRRLHEAVEQCNQAENRTKVTQ